MKTFGQFATEFKGPRASIKPSQVDTSKWSDADHDKDEEGFVNKVARAHDSHIKRNKLRVTKHDFAGRDDEMVSRTTHGELSTTFMHDGTPGGYHSIKHTFTRNDR